MDKPIIDHHHLNDHDFFIVVWDKGNGILFQEIFEGRKISEQYSSNEEVGDVLTKAKATIEAGIDTKSI